MAKVFTIAEGLENMGALRTGGQGSVYKGRRMGPIISAVKILPTPVHTESLDDKNYRNFQNEVEKLKKVNEAPNPNVVKILNSGITESGSFPFIEMEFIEGPDLEELLKPPHDAIFTLKETIKVADHLACALAHCHKVGVKHGDIKSNNVKFNVNSGNYVLLDFGLSIMSDEQRRTSMRHAGAIEFMAPEQNEGKMGFETDIYSYGIILYELLAGQVPFPLKDNGETARNAVMIAHMESLAPDLLQLRKQNLPDYWPAAMCEREMQVPGWLLQLIKKCLEKSPEKRYRNGLALQQAITEESIKVVRTESISPAIKPVINPESPKLPASVSPPDNNMIYMSKSVFGGLMLLLLGLMIFSGYSLFHKPSKPQSEVAMPVTDTAQKADSIANTARYNAYKRRKKQEERDSIQQAIRDAMNSGQNSNPADTSRGDTAINFPNNN